MFGMEQGWLVAGGRRCGSVVDDDDDDDVFVTFFSD